MSQRSGLLTSQLCHCRFSKWIFYCSPSGFELYYIPLYLSGLQNGFFASPSCFVLFIFVFVQKLCFPFDTLRNACFLIVCAELQEEKRKLASCHFFAGGGRQEGCLHSFFFILSVFICLPIVYINNIL